MSLLHLCPPRLSDHEALCRFEFENRTFFEAHINARPATFYSDEGVRAAIAQAQADAAEDRGYQFLARAGAAGPLVGRVNLSRVRRAHFHSAELGYRIAQAETGKGHAGEAVRLAIEQAFGVLDLRRIEAGVRLGNEASRRVLLRNGFRQFGHSTRSFQLAGVWYDLLHFERHAED